MELRATLCAVVCSFQWN